MKKLTAFMLILMCLLYTGCKKTDVTETTVPEEEIITEEEVSVAGSLALTELDPAKCLTVYFSAEDQVALSAEFIKGKTGGGIFEIKTVNSYPEEPEEIIKRANEEHDANVRPALKEAPGSMNEYDIVFLCFPEWAGTMPMALWTFIEDYDMRDKAVIPVCEGSYKGLANAVRDIHKLVPEMLIVDGYAFNSDFMEVSIEFDAFLDNAIYGE